MVDKIHNITKWVLIALLVLSAVAGVLFYAGTMSADTLINMGIVLIVLAAAVTLLGAIFNLASNPGGAVKMGISLVLFVVVFGVAYSLAGNHLTQIQMEEYNIGVQASKLVGMGLYATYIAFGIAVLVILYSSIVKVFK